jgi:3',5'-cyclic AMP phosphodiesterase CpdA
VIIAQITDTHIRPKGKLLHHMVHTARYLRRCVEQLEAMTPRPNVVVATGDLVERGKPKEYRRLRKILGRLSVPLFVIPGNHDEREAFRDAFADHAYLPRRGPLHYAVDALPLRLIGLDSTRAGHPGGEFDAERLAWFEAALAAAPRRPTFVFVHHPPFAIGVPPVDGQGFRNLERFKTIVERNPQIVGIASGHVHRCASTRIGATPATTAPSTSHQLTIARSAFGTYTLRLEAPGFALHAWDGHTLTTTTHVVDALAVRNLPRLASAS